MPDVSWACDHSRVLLEVADEVDEMTIAIKGSMRKQTGKLTNRSTVRLARTLGPAIEFNGASSSVGWRA